MIILIADDERLVRLALKSMIEEIEPNTHNFIEAKNGKELIGIIENNTPDLAFVDVNMPLMDGLSAIEKCKDKSPKTQWFVLTGEKEFYLVKKAITLGVKDYILKPISLDDLKPIISSVSSNKIDTLIKENEKFEFNVISTFNKLDIHKTSSNLNIDFRNKNKEYYTPYLFLIDSINDLEDKKTIYDNVLLTLREYLLSKLDNNFKFATYYIDDKKFALIVYSTNDYEIDFDCLLSSIQSKYYNTTIFSQPSCDSLFNCYRCLQNLSYYSSLRTINGFKKINLICKDNMLDNDFLLLARYILNITEYYNKKEELLYNEYIDKLKTSSSIKSIYKEMDKADLNDFLRLTINFDFDYNNGFSEFINALVNHSFNIFNSRVNNSSLINEIMSYVKSNYMNEIGVNTIASLYDITPNYLSKIFREKAGMKFIDYITSIRINESKKLLSSSDFSIKQISEMVGYHSSRHFSKQFFKVEGITPSEFCKNKIQ